MNKFEKYHQKVMAALQADKRTPLLKVIRAHCLQCCCFQAKEVENCPVEACILWPFRFGSYPEGMKIKGRARNFSKLHI